MPSSSSTARRILHSRGGNNSSADLTQALSLDVHRLAEIVKRQQEIIIEYAAREDRANLSLQRAVLDEDSRRWLESSFGLRCYHMRHQHGGASPAADLDGKSGRAKDLFNSESALKALHTKVRADDSDGLLSWSFDILAYIDDILKPGKEGDSGEEELHQDVVDRAANVVVEVICLLGIPDRLGVDPDVIKDVVQACMAAHSRKNSFHNAVMAAETCRMMAVALVNLAPAVGMHPSVCTVEVLGCLLAGLVFCMQHPGRSEEFLIRSEAEISLRFNAQNVVASAGLFHFFTNMPQVKVLLEKLGRQGAASCRAVLVSAIAAADPQRHWTVIEQIDLVTMATVRPADSNESDRTAIGASILKEALFQGIFAAAKHSFACKERKLAEKWVRRACRELEAQGKEEQSLSLPLNMYAQMCGHGSASKWALELFALNTTDFAAAPLWTALSHHLPGLAEPFGTLLVNRSLWHSTVSNGAKSHSNSELFDHLAVRSKAFFYSFANTRFQSDKARVKPELSASDKADKIVNTSDFLAVQEGSLRCTGAAATFLNCLSKQSVGRRDKARTALTNTIGFLVDAPLADSAAEDAAGNALGAKRVQHGVSNVCSILSVVEPAGSGSATRVVPLDESNSIDKLERKDDPAEHSKQGASADCDADRANNCTSSAKRRRRSHNNLVVGLPRQFLSRRASKSRSLTPKHLNKSNVHGFVIRVLEHPVTYPLLSYLTVFALFGDDLKLAVFEKDMDLIFGYITLITLLCFMIELSMKALVLADYVFGFFFWLDFVATVSLIPDIPFVWDALVSGVNSVFNSADDLSVTRAGRASRAGARAARVVRILRLVRLLRILKLYEFVYQRDRRKFMLKADRGASMKGTKEGSRYVSKYIIKRRNNTMQSGANVRSERDLLQGNADRQSKVGAKLADLTTRRVIMVVLVILFMLPVINQEESDSSFEAAVGMLHSSSVDLFLGHINASIFDLSLHAFQIGMPSLMSLEITAISEDPILGTFAEDETMRTSEVRKVVSYCFGYRGELDRSLMSPYQFCAIDDLQTPGASNLTTVASFNNQAWEQEQAWRSIAQTIFIICIFGITTMVFTYDAHKLVIAPIEKMVRIVEELAANPLTTFENDESEDENESEMLKLARKQNRTKKNEGGYETKLLENCIKKIGGLLQVGFGEAGAEIIATNMNGSGLLDPMVPGRKIQAVFGFCDIRNFMATTEVLREEVMLFVNEIANIVHSQVSAHSGNANRNMGDSFLLVWKRTASPDGNWTDIVEKALISFLKVNIDINRSPDLRQYNSPDSKIGARLRKYIPDFRVRLGFGLHIGWAIEGAIGSIRKIDASYLSPHINLAGRLEEYTRVYGVTILFSGEFYELLGDDAKKCSRKVDEVLLKGTNHPVSLYTYDCNFNDLGVKLKAIRLKGDDHEEEKVVDRRISLIGPAPIIGHNRELIEVEKSAFRTDLELRALQWELPPQFLPLCRKGVSVYLAGKWKEAKILMEAACRVAPSEKNGPCGCVLEFMAAHEFVAPPDWPGYRALGKK